MRIAIVSAFLFDNSIGGVENYVRFVCRELIRTGHEIRIFKPVFSNVTPRPESTEPGLPISRVILGRLPYDFRRWSGGTAVGLLAGFLNKLAFSLKPGRLVEAIRQWNPDVIWQHDFSSSWRATRNLSNDFPVVLTNHTGEYLMFARAPGGSLLLKLAMSHYARVIGPSRELTPAFGNAVTISSGVDTTYFVPPTAEERSVLRRSLYGTDNAFVVFCPRRWAPTKGVSVLADAILALDRQQEPEEGLIFAFAGSDYDSYPRYVAEVNHKLNQARSSILRLGNLDVYRLRPYYQAADLVVIPSLMEAVSLSALEAMACGTPVLATAVGGMPDLISPNENGYLARPGSPTELAKMISRIRRDAVRSRIAARGHDLVVQQYSWQAIAKRIEDVLKQVAATNDIPIVTTTISGGPRS